MDVVKLLPDSVANQIAAGEVVQRPASVVKELMENSVDAGATLVKVIIRAAGRQSIRVIDNGCGMSESDARLAFEKHATSKIRCAEDLFEIHTMGFRGEALPSIAAVAQVEVLTRRAGDRLGVAVNIEGSVVRRQESVECEVGTVFTVSNLFYNTPVKRKFLKSDETEIKNIIQEFQRVALAHRNVSFMLYNGDDIAINVSEESFRQRIIQLFGRNRKTFGQDLIPIETDTTIVRIEGFVGRPESAGKSVPQYFLVNNRYITHPYFRRAVMQAYERMIASDAVPMFFINLTVDPSTVDVNIHPTKTEVKFENEREIYSMIVVAIRNALGKFNISPSLEFSNDSNDFEIPVFHNGNTSSVPSMPKVNFDQGYNPFKTGDVHEKPDTRNWESMFEGLHRQSPAPVGQTLDIKVRNELGESIWYRNRWLCVALHSGLAVIDVPRALYRIEYDNIISSDCRLQGQGVIFEEILEFSDEDECIFTEISEDLREAGFSFEQFAPRMYRVTEEPVLNAGRIDAVEFINQMIAGMKCGEVDIHRELRLQMADRMALRVSQNVKPIFDRIEREELIAKLFSSSNPNNDPAGRQIVKMIEL